MAKINLDFMKPMLPSSSLAKIVGEKPLIRTEVTKKVWDYIKKHKLQDRVERRNINCDTILRVIFNNKKVVSMFEMAKYLNLNLSYPPIAIKPKKTNMSKKTKFKIGDKVEIIAKKHGHNFNIGDIVEICTVGKDDYNARNAKANWWITADEFKLATNTKPSTKMANTNTDAVRKGLVLACAQTLLSPNNTVTTLEIKTQLRKTQPAYHWTQAVVSAIMDDFSANKVFTYTDNGTYRTYSDPSRVSMTKSPRVRASKKTTVTKKAVNASPKQKYTSTITRAQALKMMANNKGHFFTATFVKTDGTTRVMNCQYLSGQVLDKTSVKVRESSLLKQGDAAIRQITLDRLKSLKIAGNTYGIKK